MHSRCGIGGGEPTGYAHGAPDPLGGGSDRDGEARCDGHGDASDGYGATVGGHVAWLEDWSREPKS